MLSRSLLFSCLYCHLAVSHTGFRGPGNGRSRGAEIMPRPSTPPAWNPLVRGISWRCLLTTFRGITSGGFNASGS